MGKSGLVGLGPGKNLPVLMKLISSELLRSELQAEVKLDTQSPRGRSTDANTGRRQIKVTGVSFDILVATSRENRTKPQRPPCEWVYLWEGGGKGEDFGIWLI